MEYHVPLWAKGKDITTLHFNTFTCCSGREGCRDCVFKSDQVRAKIHQKVPKGIIDRLARYDLIPKKLALKHMLDGTDILLKG